LMLPIERRRRALEMRQAFLRLAAPDEDPAERICDSGVVGLRSSRAPCHRLRARIASLAVQPRKIVQRGGVAAIGGEHHLEPTHRLLRLTPLESDRAQREGGRDVTRIGVAPTYELALGPGQTGPARRGVRA